MIATKPPFLCKEIFVLGEFIKSIFCIGTTSRELNTSVTSSQLILRKNTLSYIQRT
jgi:hypothetical protein